jgi:hypothetical protein
MTPMELKEARHDVMAGFSVREFAIELLSSTGTKKRENNYVVLRAFMCGNGIGGQQIVINVTEKQGEGGYEKILQIPDFCNGENERDVSWITHWMLLNLRRLNGVL